MDVYELSVDLRNGVRDMDLVAALEGYLGLLQREGLIESWRLLRRKLGLGEGSEFKVLIETTDLAQLDQAFQSVLEPAGPDRVRPPRGQLAGDELPRLAVPRLPRRPADGRAGALLTGEPPPASLVAGRADLQLHAVHVAEEERPLVTEALDLADVGARLDQALLHVLELVQRLDGDAEVVDGTPAALATLLADHGVRRGLEDVERGATPHVQDEHPGVVRRGLHLEDDLGPEHALVEVGVAVEVGREGGDVVEPSRDRHAALPAPVRCAPSLRAGPRPHASVGQRARQLLPDVGLGRTVVGPHDLHAHVVRAGVEVGLHPRRDVGRAAPRHNGVDQAIAAGRRQVLVGVAERAEVVGVVGQRQVAGAELAGQRPSLGLVGSRTTVCSGARSGPGPSAARATAECSGGTKYGWAPADRDVASSSIRGRRAARTRTFGDWPVASSSSR